MRYMFPPQPTPKYLFFFLTKGYNLQKIVVVLYIFIICQIVHHLKYLSAVYVCTTRVKAMFTQ